MFWNKARVKYELLGRRGRRQWLGRGADADSPALSAGSRLAPQTHISLGRPAFTLGKLGKLAESILVNGGSGGPVGRTLN